MGCWGAAQLKCGRALAVLLVAAGATGQTPELSLRLEAARQLKLKGSMQGTSEAYESLLPRLESAGAEALLPAALFETSQVALALGDYPRAARRADQAARLFRRLAQQDGNLRRRHTRQHDYFGLR